MKSIKIIIAFVLMAFPVGAINLPYAIQDLNRPIRVASDRLFENNPGIMPYRDTLSLSHATAGIFSHRSDQATMVQKGTGRLEMFIGVESYMHLDPRQTVWGKAGYSTGKVHNVKWADCIDYYLLAPYVLGDNTGGDLTYNRYEFGGGYACRLNRWTLGASLNYRAEIAWRSVDPRLRTIVSDLNASIGAGYQYSLCRFVGLSASVRSYSQNCAMEFYNPLNDINTLPLTGLGTYNSRFTGNTNKDSGHTGSGYTIAVEWLSTNRKGLQIAASYQSLKISEQLRNFNNLTLAFTNTAIWKGSIAYGATLTHSIKAMPLLNVTSGRRVGTENLFGTAAGASYTKIGSRSPYRHNILQVECLLPIELTKGEHMLTLQPTMIWSDSKETIAVTPSRRCETSNINGGAEIHYSLAVDSGWLFEASAAYYVKSLLSSDLKLTDPVAASTPEESVVSNFEMQSAKCHDIRSGVSISRTFGRVMGGLHVDYRRNEYRKLGVSDAITATIRITF